MQDVFDFRNCLIDEYSAFSRSFSKIAAPDLLQKVEDEYERGRYGPEPLIQINPNYKRSRRLFVRQRRAPPQWHPLRQPRRAP